MFGFGKKKEEPSNLALLLKEKQKREKEINKKIEKRMENKYTTKNLIAAKKTMLEDAKTIDTLEYEKIKIELEKLKSKAN